MIETPPAFATVAIVYRFPEAGVLVSMLRAYGIDAFAPTWHFATMSWNLTVAIGGIAVLVPAADLDDAIFLIGDPRDLPAPPRNFRCGWWGNALLALLLLGWGLPLPARAKGVYAVATQS